MTGWVFQNPAGVERANGGAPADACGKAVCLAFPVREAPLCTGVSGQHHSCAVECMTFCKASALWSWSVRGYGGRLSHCKGGAMEADLIALAAAGATAFIQQMAADSWAQARDRIVSFFSRCGGGEEHVIEGELETSRGELTVAIEAGDEQTALDVEAEWRTRLRRTLVANPAAASELRSVLDELAHDRSDQQVADVHNTISGGVQHGPVVQAGNVGSLSFGTRPGQR